MCVRASVNRLGDVAVMYKIPFLVFTIQSVAITRDQFTEIRASLTVGIYMEIVADKIF